MRDRYHLEGLGNDELLAALSVLVRRGNELTSDLLAHLAELDERRLYLELGFASLFAYCTEALGLCRSSAYRHIAAARVCRAFPEIFARMANGDLNVSTLSEMSPHLNSQNAAELFELCSRKSCRQVEELLAARFPRADVAERIRRLPLEPLSAGRFGVHFTADTEFRDLLEEVRALASYRQPGGDLASLLKAGLEAYRRELEKARFGVGTKARGAKRRDDAVPTLGHSDANRADANRADANRTDANRADANRTDANRTDANRADANRTDANQANANRADTNRADTGKLAVHQRGSGPGKRTRHIAAEVTREVYERDGKRCAFIAKDGRTCGARAWLEHDHVRPWAEGGAATVDNIRLLCRAHNLEAARKHFGAAAIRGAGRARRRRAA